MLQIVPRSVAERVGTVGLALMAFGAVGGVESGVTLGERFNVRDLRKRDESPAREVLPYFNGRPAKSS